MAVKTRWRRLLAVTILSIGFLMMLTTRGLAEDAKNATPPLAIDHLSCVDENGSPIGGEVKCGLRDWLAVVMNNDISNLDLSKATLVLNGAPIPALGGPRRGDKNTILFQLVRNSENFAAWTPIIGSPNEFLRPVLVTLQLPSADSISQPQIIGGERAKSTFQLVLLLIPSLVLGTLAVLLVIVGVVGGARSSTALKDSLLPQLPYNQQTYSLGRCQMAFWFALVFAAFVFLLLLLWDYNTVTSQALILMGVSGATAIFAVQIDASKDTPIGAANETLRALGLKTYQDVLSMQSEIKQLNAQLVQRLPGAQANPPAGQPLPPDPEVARLQTEITARQNKLRTWRDLTAPYVSQGWYRDITTDINGPALHRLQIFYWTIILGAVFIVAVYRDLAMPQFSDTLLSLMGVTSAGYLGFKFPEQQS
jgi:hypothetical protein